MRVPMGWWQPTGWPRPAGTLLLLEAQPEVGGAVRSDRELHPDFVSDTFSAFYPMAAASRVINGLHLEEYGFQWRHAPAVLGHSLANGPG